MIGDITCDIMGSIHSTLRSSTHADPYYDYNPVTKTEEAAFSNANNISVMAVDTCPNALPRDTSEYFGEMLIKHVFTPLLEGKQSPVIDRSTILRDGKLTERFAYLSDFAMVNNLHHIRIINGNKGYNLPNLSKVRCHEESLAYLFTRICQYAIVQTKARLYF